MGNNLVKKFFDGIPFIKIPIETKRKRLLNDPDVLELMTQSYVAGMNKVSYINSPSFEDFVIILKKQY